MFISTCQNLLVATLVFNVASTLGAPIPYIGAVETRQPDSAPDLQSRYLDILVPKKRFRSWNATRRAARENALKALRHAESRAAALAEIRHGIGRRHALAYSASDIRALDEYYDELERRELPPSDSLQNIGRRHPLPYSADDFVERDELEDRYLDDEMETRHARRGNKNGNGKVPNSQSTIISMHSTGHISGGHMSGGAMCPCASAPPIIKNPCPESGNTGIPTPGDGTTPLPGQPGSGTGPNEGGYGGNPSTPVSATDSASGPGPTDIPDDGEGSMPVPSASVSSSDPSASGVPSGSDDPDDGEGSEPVPSASASSSDPSASGVPSGSDDPGDSSEPSASASATEPGASGTPEDSDPSGSDAGMPSATDSASASGAAPSDSPPDDSTEERRGLFSRWQSARSVPVGRVNARNFRL